MNAITISKITAADALTFKAELDRSGLVIGTDYTWRFQPVKYNNDFSRYAIEESQVRFEFTDAAVASFYRIKWTK